MFVTVELPIDLRLSDPEVRAEIDDARAQLQKRRGGLDRHAMGQSKEDGLGLGAQLFGGWFAELDRVRGGMQSSAWENVGDALARKLPRGTGHELRARVLQKQPDQLFAGVSRRT